MPALNLADAIYLEADKAKRAYLGSTLVYGDAPTSLELWTNALANRANKPARVLWLGDSILEGTGATQKSKRALDLIAGMLDTAYPTAGVTCGEFLPQHWAMPKTGGGDGTTNTPWGGDWDDSRSGTITEYDQGASGKGPGGRSCLMASGATLTYTVTGTDIDVWTAKGGTITVLIDGTASTVINTSAQDTYGDITQVSMGAAGSHTVKLTCSVAATPFLGLTVYRGSRDKGIVSIDGNNYGAAASSSYDSAGNSSTPLNAALRRAVALAAPDLIVVNLIANDIMTELASAYGTTIAALIAAAKESAPGAAVAVFPVYEQGDMSEVLPNGDTPQYYFDAMQSAASAAGALWFLSTPPMPSLTSADTFGYYMADHMHLADKGEAVYADWLVSRIAPNLQSFIRMTTTLPASVTVGTAMSGTVSAANRGGATGAITITAPSLPAGLSIGSTTLQSDGSYQATISGTPTTEAAAANFAISASNGTQPANATWNVAVGAAGGASPTILSQTWCTPVAKGSYTSPPFASGAFDAVAGSLILVAVMQSRMHDRTINSVTDSAGNTYTKAGFTQDNGDAVEGQGMALWYCANSTAKTGNVVSCNNGGSSVNITGIRVLQISTPAGKSWSYDTGVGKDDMAAYEGSIVSPGINCAGAGLLYSMTFGNQTVAASGCSMDLDTYLGAVCGTDAPNTSNGIDGLEFRTAAVSGQTITTSFGGSNEHPMTAAWSMTLS